MAIITSYPTVVPKTIDRLIISQAYDIDADEPIVGNPTGSVTVGSIVDLVNTGLIPGTGTVTSVGVSTPSAFTVSNSPITSAGVINITGSGTSVQYIDGTGALQDSEIILNRNKTTNSLGNKTIPSNFDFTSIPASYADSIWNIVHYHDLSGATITLPANVTLNFIGGKFSNGGMLFNNTSLILPNFTNMTSLSGTLTNVDMLNDKDFLGTNDSNILSFLLENVILNNAILDLSRDYNIGSLTGVSNFAIANGNDGFEIRGNNHKITDTYAGTGNLSFLNLTNTNNVKITDLIYESSLASPTTTPEPYGVNVIKTTKDCSNLDLMNIKGVNVNSVLRAGDFGLNNFVASGLNNSRIKVLGNGVGYAVAIERGQNLDIDARFVIAHRGVYLAGVTSSKIHVTGKDATVTNVNLYLKDSVYYNASDVSLENTSLAKFIECSNLDIVSIDEGSSSDLAQLCSISSYGDSFHFSNRTTPYNYGNIRLSIENENSGSKIQGLVFSLLDHSTIKDKVSVRLLDSVFDNDEYFFINDDTSNNIQKNITIENCISSGKINWLPSDDDCLRIINSDLGLMSIGKNGEAFLESTKSTFTNLASTIGDNNVTMSFDTYLSRTSDFKRFKKVSLTGSDVYFGNDLDLTSFIQKENVIILTANSQLRLNDSLLGNGDSFSIVAKNSHTSTIAIDLSTYFTGATILGSELTFNVPTNELVNIFINKSGGTSYVYINKIGF